jgi:hypothetical protein
MVRKLLVGLAFAVLVSGLARAQDTDLQRIADAFDLSTTKAFQFTATGTMWQVGQSTSPMAAWPRYYVKSLTRIYDFSTGSMRQEMAVAVSRSNSINGRSRWLAATLRGTKRAPVERLGHTKRASGHTN